MPVDNNSTAAKPGSRLRELGLALPKPPTPLGAYVEASEVGSLLFLSGILPLVNGKLPITGRLGENLSVEQGREAVWIAAMNALAVAQQHLGDLDRLKKLVKLSVVLVTTEQFVEHAAVADGASNLSFNSSAPKTVMCGRCTEFKVCQSARLSWSRSPSRSNSPYVCLPKERIPMSKWTETEIAGLCLPTIKPDFQRSVCLP